MIIAKLTRKQLAGVLITLVVFSLCFISLFETSMSGDHSVIVVIVTLIAILSIGEYNEHRKRRHPQ